MNKKTCSGNGVMSEKVFAIGGGSRSKHKRKKKMVFCYQNCSDLLWEKIVPVIEKNLWNSRLKAKNLQKFEIARTICSNSERPEQFLVTECFLSCSWRFLRSNKLEQLEFNLAKIIGIKKHAGKVRKILFPFVDKLKV